MKRRPVLRISIIGITVGALLVASCTSSTPETDPPSTVTSTVTPESDESTSIEPPDREGSDQAAVTAMCRTLDLLSAAGVPAGRAAGSMTETDLKGVSSIEWAAYGDVLIAASRVACPEHIEYADDIAYWLGF